MSFTEPCCILLFCVVSNRCVVLCCLVSNQAGSCRMGSDRVVVLCCITLCAMLHDDNVCYAFICFLSFHFDFILSFSCFRFVIFTNCCCSCYLRLSSPQFCILRLSLQLVK